MTLLAPFFLLGMLAVGVPLWLHRLSSENPNREQFSSAMFLEPGEPRRVLAKNLQYLLLLALRIAVLVLLALAFARPALQGAAQAMLEEDARLHMLVMDTSASMRYGDRWERARQAALDVIDAAPSGDLLQLVAVGRTARVINEPTVDPASVRQSLNALAADYSHLDYGEVMSSVDRMLRGVDIAVDVHLITDLQRTSMPTRFAQLAAQAPLTLEFHDVSQPGETNWAVQSVTSQAATREVAVSVRSFATQAAERTIVLELNGERAAAQAISIPAGATVTANFAGIDLASGANRLRLYLEPGDDLVTDDQRFMVVKRPEPRTILLISADPTRRDALFLTAALEAVNGPLTVVEPVTPGALRERDLGRYAFVVVADAGVLAPADAGVLRAYVAGGGAMFLGLGQRSGGFDAVPVTGHLFLGTAQLGARADDFSLVGSMDTTHPVLAGTEELRSAKFYRYTAITPEPGDQILAALEQGPPLLIDHALDQGHVIVFTSSFDRQWNDLPVLPVFVPLIAGVSAYLAGDLAGQTEAQLGNTLSSRAVGLAGGQIFDPTGNAALGIAAGAGTEVLLDQIGFYEVVGGGITELVAVNMDPSESDLTPVESNAVERWRGLNSGADAVAANAAMELNPAEAMPLWPWVLALLIAMVFVESWVGNWHLRVRRGIAA